MNRYQEIYKQKLKEGRVDENDFLSLVNPWGFGDLEAAVDAVKDFNVDFGDIESLFDDMGGKENAENIDPVGITYQVALDNATYEIDKYLDIDLTDYVYVAANYLATNWDSTERGAGEKLTDELKLVLENDPKSFKRLSKSTIAVLKSLNNIGIIDIKI